MNNLKMAFNKQRVSAGFRGVPWMLTFDEWMDIWNKSGFLKDRGRGKGKYVMARYRDVGPYSSDNVEIIKCETNAADARSNHPRTPEQLRSQVKPGRGWTKRGNRYQVFVGKKYVGMFCTPEEANRAYKETREEMYGVVETTIVIRVAGNKPDATGSSRSLSE